MTLPAGKLRDALGIREVSYTKGQQALALKEQKLHMNIIGSGDPDGASAPPLAVSGVIHAYLYIHGYRDIPTVGPAFLVQASVFCALAVLILAGGPGWLRLGRRGRWRRARWSRSRCRAPSASSVSPNPVGNHHRTLRSASSPKC